jgi:hypothetical protein
MTPIAWIANSHWCGKPHDRNDEILESIYIDRRFKNDTERLEKLFELYTKMTTQQSPPKKPTKRKIKP